MRKNVFRLAVAGLTLGAGSIALVGTAGALPGPGYDPPFEDFGVVHLIDATPLTETGDVVVTWAYMAPEVAMSKDVLPASDQ